jgi:hypothetical protein
MSTCSSEQDEKSTMITAAEGKSSLSVQQQQEHRRIRPDLTFESHSTASSIDGGESARHLLLLLDAESTPEVVSPVTLLSGASVDRHVSLASSGTPESQHHDDYIAMESTEEWLSCCIYISIFSVFGVVLRIYMGRFFGLDCENDGEVHDFMTPLSSRICVTASGRTEQTGGAVFTDLPTNILGWYVRHIHCGFLPEMMGCPKLSKLVYPSNSDF